jgi:hypothetical protein
MKKLFGFIILATTPVYAQSYAPYQNGKLEATLFPGSDIGAQINAAYAALPATGGVITVNVPPAGLTFTTPVLINVASKPAWIDCGYVPTRVPTAGALHFTGTGTAFTFDTGGSGYLNQTSSWGMRNCNVIGPNITGTTTTGIMLGSTNGGTGFALYDSNITGFGTGLFVGDNTFYVSIDKAFINGLPDRSGVCVNNRSSHNTGENINIANSVISGCYGGTTAFPSTGGVVIGGSGMQFNVYGSAFDDAPIVDNSSGSSYVNDHFENPGLGSYVYYNSSGGRAVMVNPSITVDGTCTGTCPLADIYLSGSATLQMFGFANYQANTYVYVSDAASVTSIAPGAGAPNYPVTFAPVTGTTTGRVYWDSGSFARGSPIYTNQTSALSGGKILSSSDQYVRYGSYLDGAHYQEYITYTPDNRHVTQSGIQNTYTALSGDCTGIASALDFITSNNVTATNFTPSGTVQGRLDCVGNFHANGYYVGSPTAGTAGFTGTKVAGSCVFTIQGGIITNVTGC